MQMAAPIGGITWNSPRCHMHMHVHAIFCARVLGAPSHHPHPHPPIPPPPRGDPWNQSKFNSTWTNRDISIPCEDLKSVEIVRCVGIWWVGSGQNTKKFKKSWPNRDNSILFEDLWFVETPPPTTPPMGGCVGQWVGSGQMTKNLISLDLIKIIQFRLKIYDL